MMQKFLLSLDQYPMAAIWRIAMGFAIPPLADAMKAPFLLVFVAFLVALRIGPAFVRRVLPLSQAVREEWASRRQLAKIYDSYQWQKLFWIGIGLMAYALLNRQFSRTESVVTVLCVVGGALGLILWLRQAAANKAQTTGI